jgi:HK97 family phage major capsid protein
MATLDEVLKGINDLQEVAKGRREDATLDWANIKSQFEENINALVAQKVADEMNRRPARRIPGRWVGADGDVEDLSSLKGNRYYQTMLNFANDGVHKEFGNVMKPIDLWLAHRLLQEQVRLRHATFGGQAFEPSDDLKQAVKAMTSTGAGTGDELVPENLAAELWEDIFLASRVVSDIGVTPLPTNPFNYPLGLGDPTWRKGTENTATTVSDLTTAKITLTVTELVTEQNWSYTLDEDSIIALAPQIRSNLARSGAEIVDSFALNADATNAATGNINLDDADPADDSYYLSDGQDGIRHQWLVDNTAQTVAAGGDALADQDVVDMLVLMDKYAANPADVRIVCDVGTYLAGFLNLTNVKTLSDFGPSAVLLTGQLAAYRGVPVIISASHPKCEADGKVSTTAGNNTLGSVSAYNRNMWKVGFRRQLLIEVDRNIQTRSYIMVTSLREAVGAHGTRSTNVHTAGIANILI